MPSDDALWACVAEALEAVIVPALPEGHARLTAIHLLGVARYAQRRRDRQDADQGAVADALAAIAHNPLVPASGQGSSWERAAAALRAAVGSDAEAANEVRDRLRPVLLAQLDAALADEAPMLVAFRGRIPRG